MRTSHRHHRRVARHARANGTVRTRLGSAVGLGLLTGALVLTGPAASAASTPDDGLREVPETGREGYLVLRADPYPAHFSGLTPGDQVAWTVQARLEDAQAGSLHLRLAGSGDLVDHPSGLEVSVRSCTEPFGSRAPQAACPGSETTVLAASRLADVSVDPGGGGTDGGEAASGPAWELADIAAGSPRYLMVTLGLPTDAGWQRSLQGLTAEFGVGLYAAGENDDGDAGMPGDGRPGEPDDGGPGAAGMPETGFQARWSLVLAGVLPVAGVALLWAGRGRRSS